MPSAQVAFSGTEGSQFRATVDITRSYIGTAVENYETWTIQGYVDRIATGITGYSRPDAYYSLSAGTFGAGESTYGNVSINFSNSVGRKFTTSINNMTIERLNDGSAVSATADFYFWAGFVGVDSANPTVGWSTNAVPREATVTTTSGNIYETDNPSISFTNPAGFPVNVVLRVYEPLPSVISHDVAPRTNVTSPYTWTLSNAERDEIRAIVPNATSTDLFYVAETNYGSSSSEDTSDSASTITIDNRAGIASPTFTTWAITDTHAGAIGATSGGNPVMVQGKSIPRATVTVANKAVAIKAASMSSYTFTVGPSSQSVAYSGVADVTKDISLATYAPLISGAQTMSLTAVDSRTYSTVVNKSVLVLPYAAPYFPPTIKVGYTNRFDVSGGLSVTIPGGTDLLYFSPLNYSGTDYNVINTTSGVQYQLHKNTINSGNPWHNIATTTTTGTGVQNVTAATLATDILTEMNALGADNEVNWYVTFKVVDKYNTITSQVTIDIGAPIFRIGVDGNVYNNEKRILTTGDYTPDGWHSITVIPDLITALGQRSFTVRYPNVDYSGTLSKGMRKKFTRSTAAPTQCTSLNGTNQYFSNTSPAGMTFTDDFALSAWIKVSSYASGYIVSRYNGTSGWALRMNSNGAIELFATNAAAGNFRTILSSASVPLNKWVHVAAQLDMSSYPTVSSTTSYIMFDGVEMPAVMSQGGTNPTALVQAGALEIGSQNGGGTPFGGKIAQVAIFNAKVTPATMLGHMNQGLAGAETSLISAYSFNNSITDLNTTNANNLTANNSAAATNSDSPFAQGADAVTANGVTEYGIITNVSYSAPNTTITVQTPEGSVLPTTGTIASSSYSAQKSPYGFPTHKSKWRVSALYALSETVSIGALNQWYIANAGKLVVPAGDWELSWQGEMQQNSSVAGQRSFFVTLFNSTPANISGAVLPVNLILTQRIYTLASGATSISNAARVSNLVNVTSATTYNTYGAIDASTGSETWSIRGDQVPMLITADNGYL